MSKLKVKAAEVSCSWWRMTLTITNHQQPSCDDSLLYMDKMYTPQLQRVDNFRGGGGFLFS